MRVRERTRAVYDSCAMEEEGKGLTLCTDAERYEGKARLEGAARERRECPLPSLLTYEMETKVLNRQTQGRICP